MKEDIVRFLREEAEKSTCPRAKCSAIAVTDNDSPDEVVGWNRHVGDAACVIEDNHCVSAIHAEAAVIAKAAQDGISLKGACLVSLQRPCQRCMVLMSEAGIADVHYVDDYHSKAHATEFCSPNLMKELKVKRL